MKKFKKALVLFLCAVLLVAGSVAGTLAYLTSQDTATNTFTVCEVAIDLWEHAVDADGKATTEITQTGNAYDEIQPGLVYSKDPTVTVKADSEDCYVRMLVDVTYLKEADVVLADHDYLNWFDWNAAWANGVLINTVKTDTHITRTYEFRYNTIVSEPASDFNLEPLFTEISIPAMINNVELATLEGLQMVITAHAIQADGFTNADEAWNGFAVQQATNPNP